MIPDSELAAIREHYRTGTFTIRPETFIIELIDELLAKRERVRLLEHGAAALNEEICQTLGEALGYPRFCDDQKNWPGSTPEDGVAVGDHVAESLADEAARAIKKLRCPWRPIAELGEEHKEDGRYLLGRDEKTYFHEFYWTCVGNEWRVYGNRATFYDLTHFMEIPELENQDA